jgi:hypothetical protein
LSKAIDMVGKRYGRLVVLKRDGNSSNGGARWLCQCDCGVVCTVDGTRLRSGITSSCGCLRAEIARERFKTDPKICRNKGRRDHFYTETGLPYSSLRASKRNHTGVVGVSLDRKTGKWFARLMIHNRYVLLKSFDQFEEAVAARKTAEKKYLYK